MGNPIAVGALLTPGLRAEFARVYSESYLEEGADIDGIIGTVPSDKIKEIFGYPEAAPYPVRWDRGNLIGSASLKSVQNTIFNNDFGRRIYVHSDDIGDDQTGQAWVQARELGRNWGSLRVRIFYQYIQAGTDNDLLKAVPNSADGNALYITGTRFGSSSGNTVTQSGSSTVQQLINDLFSVKQRFIDFQNTQSQPLMDPGIIQRNGLHIFYGSSMNQLFEQAMKQSVVHSTIAGSSTTNVQTGAGVSNLVMATGYPITLTVTQRITNTAFYCFVRGLPTEKRPLTRLVREGFSESQGNWETSDHTRNTGELYVQFKSREGWGSMVPYGTVKVV